MTPASRIELQIGELVLHGVAPRDRQAVADAFAGELTRLLTERGVPEELGEDGGQVESVDATMAGSTTGLGPGHLGTRIAAAVYAGLGGRP
jgi:hypothetical protein